MLQPLWTLPCIIALRFWPGLINDAWGTYAIITVLLSYPYCRTSFFSAPLTPHKMFANIASHNTDAILVAWTSKNANNVGTRTVASALYNVSTHPNWNLKRQ